MSVHRSRAAQPVGEVVEMRRITLLLLGVSIASAVVCLLA